MTAQLRPAAHPQTEYHAAPRLDPPRVLDLPPDQRVEGTAATVALSIVRGADIVRVHDTRAMVRVVRMMDAMLRADPAGGNA